MSWHVINVLYQLFDDVPLGIETCSNVRVTFVKLSCVLTEVFYCYLRAISQITSMTVTAISWLTWFRSSTLGLLLCFLPQECPQCHQMVGANEIGVVAPKFGNRTLWHPSCFVCCVCEELLVDLTYCVHDDLLYCERHYAEQLKPRCAACDEVSPNTAGG